MRFRCDVRPALQFEQLLETMFALDRRQDEQEGMPSPLRLAVIARAHFDVVRLPFPPAFVQRIGLALGAPLEPALRLPTDLRRCPIRARTRRNCVKPCWVSAGRQAYRFSRAG